MALVLGEAKSANPMPINNNVITIRNIGVCSFKKMKGIRPAVVIDMPIVATSLGSSLSDNLPASGLCGIPDLRRDLRSHQGNRESDQEGSNPGLGIANQSKKRES